MHKIPTIIYSFTLGLAVAAAVAYGLVYYNFLQPEPEAQQTQQPETEWVHSVRINLRRYVKANVEGNEVDIPKRLSLMGNPNDLYLIIKMRDGKELKTHSRDNTPIGNGLDWHFEPPLRLADIHEVWVYDAGNFADSKLDRMFVESRFEEGENFSMTFYDQPRKHPLKIVDTTSVQPEELLSAPTPGDDADTTAVSVKNKK